jgi:hypothetical protein
MRLFILATLLLFASITHAEQIETDCTPLYNSFTQYFENQSPKNADQLMSHFSGGSKYRCIDSENIRSQYFSTHSFILETFTNNLEKLEPNLNAEDEKTFDLMITWYRYMTDGFYSQELLKTIGNSIVEHPKFFLKSLKRQTKYLADIRLDTMLLSIDSASSKEECTKIRERQTAINSVQGTELESTKLMTNKLIEDHLVEYCEGL